MPAWIKVPRCWILVPVSLCPSAHPFNILHWNTCINWWFFKRVLWIVLRTYFCCQDRFIILNVNNVEEMYLWYLQYWWCSMNLLIIFLVAWHVSLPKSQHNLKNRILDVFMLNQHFIMQFTLKLNTFQNFAIEKLWKILVEANEGMSIGHV